ncbi:nucleoporin, putative [Perkinsus marinus ATCC 50983]|nr:nucleoporin, putative [Perkinsus marinus ATCC 50983]EER18968.1 nucleoporin, putative [Perkinsus marinus ATCC 50983]|eukprot:XP_002787172.1 nucleoporin, putative [Perkinsus marinus ATCC 50983]
MVPKLEDPNMWIRPSLDALSLMSEAELARVDNLAIGHYSYGKITWPGLTDVRYLSVDDTVKFTASGVVVFLDDSVRPPVGKGLNKPAVVELYVKPKNAKKARQQPEKYIDRMRQLTEALNDATFLSYDLETWRFKVDNFNRGLGNGPLR